MMSRLEFQLVLTLLLVSTTKFCEAFGKVDYNDECEFSLTDTGTGTVYSSDIKEWKLCNTERGLYCVPGLGRCGCYVPLAIYRGGKCRAKVNYPCLSLDNIKIDCVDNAFCNNTGIAWKCNCNRGYLSNAENTSCFPASEATREWREHRDCQNYNNRYNSYWCNNSIKASPLIELYLLGLLSIFMYVKR